LPTAVFSFMCPNSVTYIGPTQSSYRIAVWSVLITVCLMLWGIFVFSVGRGNFGSHRCAFQELNSRGWRGIVIFEHARQKLAQAVTILICTREVLGSRLDRDTEHPDRSLSWFSSAGIIHQTRPWQLPFTFFPVHYSWISLSFDATYPELIKAQLNTPQIKKTKSFCSESRRQPIPEWRHHL
jgi:hypothetical protein